MIEDGRGACRITQMVSWVHSVGDEVSDANSTKLEEAIARLDEVMKANRFFDLPEPHKVTSSGERRFDEWTVEEEGQNLDCPVCKKNFAVKLKTHVIPARKNFEERRDHKAEFLAFLQKARGGSIDHKEWAVCSDECETILQLRLDGIKEEQQRELAALSESRKLAKAARKLAVLGKRDENPGS